NLPARAGKGKYISVFQQPAREKGAATFFPFSQQRSCWAVRLIGGLGGIEIAEKFIAVASN
ncbi:MAG: hypothetical protein K2P57_09290, partial [Burkholderiales bacterium]|nr:hypothetical protein [Burkholderiales bacterium]